MADFDGSKAELHVLTPGDALALRLGIRAVLTAGKRIAAGGYRTTAEQMKRIEHELAQEAIAAGTMIAADAVPITNDELDAAADLSAEQKVVEILGPARVN